VTPERGERPDAALQNRIFPDVFHLREKTGHIHGNECRATQSPHWSP
jgi:hypothetical protein